MDEDWDRHWNTLCLGILTLATATVGAAFFAGGVANIDLSSNDHDIQILQATKFIFIFGALLVLIRLVGAASKAIFTSSPALEHEGTSKRAQTEYVYLGFTLIIMALIALLVIDFFTGLGAALG